MLSFSTKASVLEELSKVITTANILPLLKFTVGEFELEKNEIIINIQQTFSEEKLIIRSSAKAEDNFETSNAGKFDSILNINKNEPDKIKEAIGNVIASYESYLESNEVLVQPMLKNIAMSGVVITADIDTLSPYYIINFDESSDSESVTSGKAKALKTYIRFKDSPFDCSDKRLAKLLAACTECEKIFDNKFLDIEFAFDDQDNLFIFQVRPLVRLNKEDLSDIDLKEVLEKIYKKFKKLSSKHPHILGDKTVLGVMPDWNPAEIIGIKPKRLSLSLYKELITDNIWAFQRDNYGYRNLRSYPLLISFLGVPYIDSRVSFNSFIPKSLNEGIAAKLADYYLNKLANTPHLHDKVEFEIVHSCYYLNLPLRLKQLLDFGFNENEIKRIEFSLLELTNNIISPESGLYKDDLKRIEILRKKYDDILNSELSIIDKIYWLIEDCKRYGTLPFAGVARAAFIAVQFLKSFVETDIISKTEYDKFMNSLNTVSKELNSDLYKLSKNLVTREEFLSDYGHLRPGTYDILSQRYDENFEGYFSINIQVESEVSEFEFSKEQDQKIERALIENGIKINTQQLICFIREAIQGREYTKFVFTKSLSQILKLLEELASRFEISREDLAYLDIKEVIAMYATLDHRDVKVSLLSDINKNKEFYRYTKAIKLPGIIVSPQNIYDFYLNSDEPNFITLNRIKAEVFLEENLNSQNPKNKIVFIKSADPGYDFLFTKNIAGLVTQYGGVNSHMAIRCAELGLPAIIGVGEKNFKDWSVAKTLEIDCANRQVRCIN